MPTDSHAPRTTEPTHADILAYIETNAVLDDRGGYTVRDDKTMSNMMGVLCPLREEPSQCFTAQSAAEWKKIFPGRESPIRDTASVLYDPPMGTPTHHAAICWRLSKPLDDHGKSFRYFPAEAMRHLRLAVGILESDPPGTGSGTTGDRQRSEPAARSSVVGRLWEQVFVKVIISVITAGVLAWISGLWSFIKKRFGW